MIHRHRVVTVTRAVEALWSCSAAVTQKQKCRFHYQQPRQGQHGNWQYCGNDTFKIKPKDIAMNVQAHHITDTPPEEMETFIFYDLASNPQSSPQKTDNKEKEDKRSRLRALFEEWDKKHNFTLSWTKFYDKYRDTTGDIAEPDDMSELQLQTHLFADLETNAIDDILVKYNNEIEQNNKYIKTYTDDIKTYKKVLLTNTEEIKTYKDMILTLMTREQQHSQKNSDDLSTTSENSSRTDKNENFHHEENARPSTTTAGLSAQTSTLKNTSNTTYNTINTLTNSINTLHNTNSMHTSNITTLNNNISTLSKANAKLKVRVEVMKGLKNVEPVSPDYSFTQSFSFGMVGRSGEFLEVMHQLVRGMGTAVKESNRPIAILSAPRHGKSLLLQAVLEALRPPPTARDLPLVELFGASMPEIPKDVVVLALSLNGKSKIEDKYRANARRAAAYLWSCVLGLTPDSGYVETGELAAWVLRHLFPGKQVVLLVDELTNLTDAFIDNKKELKLLANNVLSFFGTHTTMVFTGFDAALTSSFISASGRPPYIVPLPPINPNSPDFMTFLPLRTLLTDLYILDKNKQPNLLMLYELAKSTPGVLGAVAEQTFYNIPIVQSLRGKGNESATFSAEVILLMEEYVKVIAEGGNVTEGDGLGAQLLEKKIGALWCGSREGSLNIPVYIPPIFAYAAMADQTPRSEFHGAFNAVVELMESWLKFLHEHSDDTDTGVRTAWAQSGGLLYELFVLAALRMQDVVLLKGLSYASAPARLPRGSRYPAEQGVTVEGTWLTAEGTQSVDIVRSLGGGRQQWIEIKNRSARIDTETIKTLVSGVKKHLGNVSKDITEVEYIVVTHIPSSTVMHKQVSKIDIMKAMREQLPAAEEKHFSDGRRVRLTYRIVFVGTAEAARFLSPLVASIAPNTGALQGDTCEKRLLIQSLNDPCWLSLKSKEEIEQLVLDKKSLERHTPVLIQCEAAARDAERLHRELY